MKRWLLLVLTCGFYGCATAPRGPTFSQRAHQQCVDGQSCRALLDEARQRRIGCNSRGDCPKVQADVTWLFDEANRHDFLEKQAQNRAKAAELEAEQERQKAEAQEAAAKAEKEAVAKAEARELKDWQEAHPESCKQADTIEACDALKRYSIKYHDGSPHLADAEKVLAEAWPKIVAFKDDVTWSESSLADCKAPKKIADCNGVLAYLEQYPQGKHASDANKLIKSQYKKLEAMGEAEHQKYLAAIDRCKDQIADGRAKGYQVDVSRDYEGKTRVRWCGTPISSAWRSESLAKWKAANAK